MGKIYINWKFSSVSLNSYFPSLRREDLLFILGALPNAKLISINYDCLTSNFVIEANDINFDDDTEINFSFKSVISIANGIPVTISVPDGFIFQKRSPQTSSSPGTNGTVSSPANNTQQSTHSYTIPSGYYASPIYNSGTQTGQQQGGLPIYATPPPWPTILPVYSDEKCVCGADKVGGLHSDWCDKKN